MEMEALWNSGVLHQAPFAFGVCAHVLATLKVAGRSTRMRPRCCDTEICNCRGVDVRLAANALATGSPRIAQATLNFMRQMARNLSSLYGDVHVRSLLITLKWHEFVVKLVIAYPISRFYLSLLYIFRYVVHGPYLFLLFPYKAV